MPSPDPLRKAVNECERRRRAIWKHDSLTPQDRVELAALEERIESLWDQIRRTSAGQGIVLGVGPLRKAKRIAGQVSATLKRTTFRGLESYR